MENYSNESSEKERGREREREKKERKKSQAWPNDVSQGHRKTRTNQTPNE
jgi:hypothetical protein